MKAISEAPVLLINCARDDVRRSKTIERMKQDVPSLSSKLIVFNAVDGHKDKGAEALFIAEKIRTGLPGSDGCALSLKKVWQGIVTSADKNEWFYVLEDDVIFHEQFEKVFKEYLTHIPADAGILWLGYCSLDGPREQWWIPGWPLTTHAYIISKRAATDMLRVFGECRENVDLHLRKRYESEAARFSWKSYALNHLASPLAKSARQLPVTKLGVYFRGIVYQDHGDANAFPSSIHRVTRKKSKSSEIIAKLRQKQTELLFRIASTPTSTINNEIKWNLVITHCEESLAWLDKITPRTYGMVYIYHKGNKTQNAAHYGCPVNVLWIPVENVGREGATIMQHCLRMKRHEVTALPSHFTVFMQSDPDPHIHRGTMFPLHETHKYYSEADYRACALDFYNNAGVMTYSADSGYDKMKEKGHMKATQQGTMSEYYEYLFKRPFPATTGIPVSYCNVFGVRNYRILAHSDSFYERALRTLNHHINPEEGHYFERLTRSIFGGTSPYCPLDAYFQPIRA